MCFWVSMSVKVCKFQFFGFFLLIIFYFIIFHLYVPSSVKKMLVFYCVMVLCLDKKMLNWFLVAGSSFVFLDNLNSLTVGMKFREIEVSVSFFRNLV
jgi:hypothetical protein